MKVGDEGKKGEEYYVKKSKDDEEKEGRRVDRERILKEGVY